MYQKYNYVFLLVLFINFSFLSAQVTNEGMPESWKFDLETIEAAKFPKVDVTSLLEEDRLNDEDNLPYRFGHTFSTNYNIINHGEWTELPTGGKIWRMRFQSKDAISLNFLLEDFEIPHGAKIYLYNNDRSDMIGAYDAQQNNENRTLSTWLVYGDDVWIEYYEPRKVEGQGYFSITKVVHGYRTQNTFIEEKALNDSGACNHDVDCPIGDLDEQKDHVKKSVGLIMINNSSWCSGALINNTNHDGTPYFLTADHCFSNPANWAFRFNWISPNPVCGQNQNSANSTFLQTMSGSTLKARRQQTDFMLVEINNPIPDDWDVVYAGWDRSDDTPSRTFGVHHPAGDIMKVCRDDDAPLKVVQQGSVLWRVENWELGVTEGGSSGSALFDEDGRIIGQLLGGSAACFGTNNNGGFDVYGRLGVSWNAGNLPSNRLRDWLDPNNTQEMSIGQYPPLETFSLDAAISIHNIDNELCENVIQPVLRLTNNGQNTLTSASLSYGLSNSTPSTMEWTGSLEQGEFEDIELDPITISTPEGSFEASVSNPNNATDENLDNTSSSASYNVTDTFLTNQVTLSLQLDDFPDETTWEFTNSAGAVLYSGGPYQNTQLITEDFVLAEDDCYTFTIFDEFGDGICCGYGLGSFELLTSDGEVIYEGGEFASEDSVTFNNHIVLSSKDFDWSSQIEIYPNPATNHFFIRNNSTSEMEITLYTISGKKINQQKQDGEVTQISTQGLAQGIYLVKLTSKETNLSTTKKLIIK